MLKIGTFSKLSRISIRMLRHYDETGLMIPQRIDGETGYRYYGEEQLRDASRITALRDMGFGLAAIGEILASYGDPAALERFLRVRRTEMHQEADEVNRRLLLLDTAITRLRKDESAMNYTVTLKTLPARYVASVRQVIPAYDQEHILWETMMNETAPLHLQPAENCLSLAIFHDMEHKESDVDVEIQGAVKGSYTDTAHVRFKTVPPLEVASAVYKGGYEQITEVNLAVAAWVRDNGYRFSGPMLCIYHVSPAQTQNPDELVTEVCYPVAKGN